MFARLRAEQPVYWNELDGGAGFWALTRHEEVQALGRDPFTFSVERQGNMIFDQFVEVPARPRMMLELDPPLHTRYRRLAKVGFSPRAIQRLLPAARARMSEIVDAALQAGDCDFVEAVGGALPLHMIGDLMGVPQELRARVYEVANRVMAFSDPEFSEASGGENVVAIDEMRELASELARERRDHPGEDLSSILLAPDDEGECLGEEEFELFFLMLVVAGIETTRSAIAGGMLAFHEHPEEWRRLQADPRLIPSAIEEMLRWTSPIHHFRRTALRDTQIAGTKIREGERVVMWYTSANRDPAVFPEPGRFDIARFPNEHLSFGFGRHFCLGARLARMELQVTLETLLERDVRMDLRDTPRYMRSNFAHSLKHMPVTLRARR
ncbi:MAG: cytochrome P450 [Myxococcales bacterium]|nr:cytochrome P450 [Myxococcales bacterium]